MRINWDFSYGSSYPYHRTYAYSADGNTWTILDATGNGQGSGCLCGGTLTDTMTDGMTVSLSGITTPFKWFGISAPGGRITQITYTL